MNDHAKNPEADRFAEMSEADAADQATPVTDDDFELGFDGIERETARSMTTLTEAEVADVWEQNLPAAAGDDDDYDRA